MDISSDSFSDYFTDICEIDKLLNEIDQTELVNNKENNLLNYYHLIQNSKSVFGHFPSNNYTNNNSIHYSQQSTDNLSSDNLQTQKENTNLQFNNTTTTETTTETINKTNLNNLTIPNIEMNWIDYKINNNNEILINLTSLIKQSKLTSTPSSYKPKNNEERKFEIVKNCKYVDVEWAINFMLNSVNFIYRDKFIKFIITSLSFYLLSGNLLFKENTNKEIKTTNLDISNFNLKKRKKITELTDSSYRNKIIEKLISTVDILFMSIEEDWIEILGLYFSINSNKFFNLIEKVCTKLDNSLNKLMIINCKKKINNLFNNLQLNISKYAILYFKDFYQISDTLIEKFRIFIGLQNIIPCENTINNYRQTINNNIKQKYNIIEHKKFIFCNVKNLILDFLNIIEFTNKTNINTIKAKLCLDGGAKTFVVNSLVFLNNLLSNQSRDNHLIIGMSEEKENKNVLINLLNNCNNILNDMILNGIIYKNRLIKFELFLVNDLKALGLISDLNNNNLFCPFCECCKNDRHEFERIYKLRELHYICNLNVFTMICPLHMRMRVISNLLIQYLKRNNNPLDWSLIEKRISKLNNFSQFKWRNERYEDEDDIDQNLPQLPYLNGSQVNELLINFEIVFKDYFDECEILIWKIVRLLFFNYIIPNKEEYKENNEIKIKLEFYCKWLGKLLKYRYRSSKFGYYIHILICHLPDLIYKYGNINQFSNEGSENIHSLHLLGLERSTASGGCVYKSEMEQLFYQSQRKIYLSSEYNLNWLGKLKKEESNYNLIFEDDIFIKLNNLQNNVNWENEFDKFIKKTKISTNQPSQTNNLDEIV